MSAPPSVYLAGLAPVQQEQALFESCVAMMDRCVAAAELHP